MAPLSIDRAFPYESLQKRIMGLTASQSGVSILSNGIISFQMTLACIELTKNLASTCINQLLPLRQMN